MIGTSTGRDEYQIIIIFVETVRSGEIMILVIDHVKELHERDVSRRIFSYPCTICLVIHAIPGIMEIVKDIVG